MNKGTTLGLLALSAVATVINVTLAAGPAAAPLPSAPPGAASASAWRWNPFFGPEPSPADRATAIQWLRRASSELQSVPTAGKTNDHLAFDIPLAQAVLGDAEGFQRTVTWLRPRSSPPRSNDGALVHFFSLGGAFAMVGDETGVRECIELTQPIYRHQYDVALRVLALAGRDQEILSVMPREGGIYHYPIYIRPAMIARRAGHPDAHDRLLAAGEATIETEVQRRLNEEGRIPPPFRAGKLHRHRYDVCRDFIQARVSAGQLDAARKLIERLGGNQRVEQFALLARQYYKLGDRAACNALLRQAVAGLPEAMNDSPPDCFDALCAAEAAVGDLPAARRHLQVLRAKGQRTQGASNRVIDEAENAIVLALFESGQDKLGYTELEIVKRKRLAQGKAEEFPDLLLSIAYCLAARESHADLQQFLQRYTLPDKMRQKIDEAARLGTPSATRPATRPTAADVERQLVNAKDGRARASHLSKAANSLTGVWSITNIALIP